MTSTTWPSRADQPIWDSAARQHILEGARLRVGAVEDREVGVAALLRLAQSRDLVGDELRLLDLVVGLHRHYLLAPRAARPEALLGPFGIRPDHLVGGIQDGLAGAVVLLEANHMRVRIVLAEVEDVTNVRTAEPVDGLVV